MDKPVKRVRVYWDYHDIIHYIEDKYNIDSRDMAGMFAQPEINRDVEHLDFWHWILHNYGFDKGFIYLNFSELENEPEDWVKRVLGYIKEEFCPDEQEIEMWVE